LKPRFLADENLNFDIVRGLLRRMPDLDLLRVQEVGLAGATDPVVLAWAAEAGRIVISHDVSTMIRFAIERLSAGQLMAGLVVVPCGLQAGMAIEDLHLIAECAEDEEVRGRVLYLPLR